LLSTFRRSSISRRTGVTQYAIVVLCGLVMFLDGFDTQAISYMAPSIAKQ
jgi:AAHS family 4-hydroxybenzoate transporter-like MFS transporter